MSRRNLTSNRRSFGRNPRTFLDKVSESPIALEVNDGVNPTYTISVDPLTAVILNRDSLPGTVSVDPSRPITLRDPVESVENQ